MDELSAKSLGMNTNPKLNIDPRVFERPADVIQDGILGWHLLGFTVWREIDSSEKVLRQWVTHKGEDNG